MPNALETVSQVPAKPEFLLSENRDLLRDLFAESRALDYGLDLDAFAGIIDAILAKHDAARSSNPGQRDFLRSLRVEELALARGCASGNEHAWEEFMGRYREKLYDIAQYIAHEASAARDLADSIYAELYGLRERSGRRVSKLEFYTGRGSLEGWLRTVLAQEFVNRFRKTKKLVSLDEEEEAGVQFQAPTENAPTTPDSALDNVVGEALSSLPPEDRYVLSAYYLDDRTLAEIGRTLGMHESTISRKVDKLAKLLRKKILALLRDQGWSRRQAEEALQSDVRDLNLDIRTRLAQD